MDKNRAYAEVAKKEMDRLEKVLELKRKTESIGIKEEELIKAQSDISELKKTQVKQTDLINRLNKIHGDTVKRLEDQEDEMEQKGAYQVEKNSLVKTLEQEVEEYKVIVREYKEKLKQVGDHHRINMEE